MTTRDPYDLLCTGTVSILAAPDIRGGVEKRIASHIGGFHGFAEEVGMSASRLAALLDGEGPVSEELVRQLGYTPLPFYARDSHLLAAERIAQALERDELGGPAHQVREAIKAAEQLLSIRLEELGNNDPVLAGEMAVFEGFFARLREKLAGDDNDQVPKPWPTSITAPLPGTPPTPTACLIR